MELALSEFDSVDHLPNRILLCGGGSSLKRVVEGIEQAASGTKTYRSQNDRAYSSSSRLIGRHRRYDGRCCGPYVYHGDEVLRVGYDTMVSSQDANGLMDKVNRLLKI